MKIEESVDRLKGLGWDDVTEEESKTMRMKLSGDPDTLYMAFKRKDMGIRYCYSDQEVIDFLEQVKWIYPKED